MKIHSSRLLPLSFFEKDTIEVARSLLGHYLCKKQGDQFLVGQIVETEAYLGLEDPVCHSFGGKKTKRNLNFYQTAGFSYVYFTYGMHFCFNVITMDETKPEAVLIRALKPILGIDIMKTNRKKSVSQVKDLTNGPSKLTQSFKINQSHNGILLNKKEFCFLEGGKITEDLIEETARIGVQSTEDAHLLPLRFFIKDSPYVSAQ